MAFFVRKTGTAGSSFTNNPLFILHTKETKWLLVNYLFCFHKSNLDLRDLATSPTHRVPDSLDYDSTDVLVWQGEDVVWGWVSELDLQGQPEGVAHFRQLWQE